MVRILEAGIRLDYRGRCKIRQQLSFAEERSPILPLAAVGAVAGDTGAVRKQLGDCRRRNLRMQALDVPPDAIIKAELTLFAKLHNAGGSKAL